MLNFQNISFENRVVVAINAIYVLLPLFFTAFGNGIWNWEIFLFWCSFPVINGILYWVISGYKKQKGTKFGFGLKLIIASWALIAFFGLLTLTAIFA